MNAKPTPEHIDAFVAHVVATLPDSLRLRKTVLVTMLSLIPRSYPRRCQVTQLIEAMRAHEQHQLKFANLLGAAGDGDGHPHS